MNIKYEEHRKAKNDALEVSRDFDMKRENILQEWEKEMISSICVDLMRILTQTLIFFDIIVCVVKLDTLSIAELNKIVWGPSSLVMTLAITFFSLDNGYSSYLHCMMLVTVVATHYFGHSLFRKDELMLLSISEQYEWSHVAMERFIMYASATIAYAIHAFCVLHLVGLHCPAFGAYFSIGMCYAAIGGYVLYTGSANNLLGRNNVFLLSALGSALKYVWFLLVKTVIRKSRTHINISTYLISYAESIMRVNDNFINKIPPCQSYCTRGCALIAHRLLILFVCAALMFSRSNYSTGAIVYTLLHSIYELIQCFDILVFEYYQKPSSLGSQIVTFLGLALSFYSIPFYHIFIAHRSHPRPFQLTFGTMISITGMILGFCYDIERNLTLRWRYNDKVLWIVKLHSSIILNCDVFAIEQYGKNL